MGTRMDEFESLTCLALHVAGLCAISSFALVLQAGSLEEVEPTPRFTQVHVALVVVASEQEIASSQSQKLEGA